MHDVLIVGGGVIGLSLAYELAGRGRRVRVLERDQPGRATSWAGAGILPPRGPVSDDDALGRLAGLSFDMHPRWAEELRELTDIDNGLRRSGGLYLARDEQTAADLAEAARGWQARGIAAEPLEPAALAELEPALAVGAIRGAYRLPDECQIRNPRHMKALVAACLRRGVEITPNTAVEEFIVRRGLMKEVLAGGETIRAEQFCLAAGSWTAALTRRLGFRIAIKPIRGQIVLLQAPLPPVGHVVNEGKRYLVPRADGLVLVGSTEEDVGFDARPTAAVIGDLLRFATSLAPRLGAARIARTWAGLRPATEDGLPYLGQAPGVSNAFVAAGHYRAGIELSPGTALVMSQLLCGETPAVDLQSFRVDRHLIEEPPAILE